MWLLVILWEIWSAMEVSLQQFTPTTRPLELLMAAMLVTSPCAILINWSLALIIAPRAKYPNCTGSEATPRCARKCIDNGASWRSSKHYGAGGYSVCQQGEDSKCSDAMMQEIYQNGPITGMFFVHQSFLSYKSGVYKAGLFFKDPMLGGHAIKIMGWGTENGTPYWLVANSWNADWGDHGYFKIERGTNQCQIENPIINGGPVAGLPKLSSTEEMVVWGGLSDCWEPMLFLGDPPVLRGQVLVSDHKPMLVDLDIYVPWPMIPERLLVAGAAARRRRKKGSERGKGLERQRSHVTWFVQIAPVEGANWNFCRALFQHIWMDFATPGAAVWPLGEWRAIGRWTSQSLVGSCNCLSRVVWNVNPRNKGKHLEKWWEMGDASYGTRKCYCVCQVLKNRF